MRVYRLPSWSVLLVCLFAPFLSPGVVRAEPTLEGKLAHAGQLVKQGEKQKAYDVYLEILSGSPGCGEALCQLGRMDFTNQDYKLAGQRLARCLEMKPKDVQAWRILGRTRMNLQDYIGASEAFHRANGIAPVREYEELEAQALMASGRNDAARKILEELVKQDPKEHRAIYFLANLCLSEGQKGRAQELYEEAIRLHPSLVEAYVNLASILFGEGHYGEAASLLEKTFKEVALDAPFDPSVRYNLGLCYLKAGEKEKAVENFEQYLKLAPQGKNAEAVSKILSGLTGGPSAEKKND